MEFHVWSNDGDFLGGISVHSSMAHLWDIDAGIVDTRINVNGERNERLWDICLNAFANELGVDNSELYLTDANDSQILWAP